MDERKEACMHCITLPVEDLDRSYRFYAEGMGFEAPAPDPDADHVSFKMNNGMYFVIVPRETFSAFATPAFQTIAPRGESECIMSCFVQSESEVDTMLARTESAGGTIAKEAQQMLWGYSGYVKDPDGHLWEFMFNASLLESKDHAPT